MCHSGGEWLPCCVSDVCASPCDVPFPIKLLRRRNEGGTGTKQQSQPYLSQGARMLISAEFRDPAFIQAFGILLTR